ncbi:MAG TPA: MBL fold metallo-hydrolase [Longimicrobiales bacterium]|nr:MBL fold metallo-hydrolase [Longimicrobiales bacterium]
MRLRFLGTRGNIDARSWLHRLHASLGVAYRGRWVMIDCGADWRDRLAALRPRAIVITHAHPDHAAGLSAGAPCPVYATEETWAALRRWPIEHRVVIRPREPIRIRGLTFEAFPVVHSIRAPAVGYRITGGLAAIFYVPDLVSIPDVRAALGGVRLYVGDGASLVRPVIRWRDGVPFGHSPIRTQLRWCAEAGVPRAIFSHCGTGIVTAEPSEVEDRVRSMGRELGVEASVAYDGLELGVRGARRRRARPGSAGRRPCVGSERTAGSARKGR